MVFYGQKKKEIGKILRKLCEWKGVEVLNAEDKRDLVVTLKLVYNPEEFEGKTPEEINAIVKADVEKINDKLPPYKRIKRVYTTDEPMEKTSTQKVKRFVETQKIIDEEKAEKLRLSLKRHK